MGFLESDSQPVRASQLLLTLVGEQASHPAARCLFLTQLPHTVNQEKGERKTVPFGKPPQKSEVPSPQLWGKLSIALWCRASCPLTLSANTGNQAKAHKKCRLCQLDSFPMSHKPNSKTQTVERRPCYRTTNPTLSWQRQF